MFKQFNWKKDIFGVLETTLPMLFTEPSADAPLTDNDEGFGSLIGQ